MIFELHLISFDLCPMPHWSFDFDVFRLVCYIFGTYLNNYTSLCSFSKFCIFFLPLLPPFLHITTVFMEKKNLHGVYFYLFFFLILQFKTGLPLSTYFSAVKLRWLLDNVEEIRRAVEDGRAMFGTVDSWLIWVCICEFISSLLKINFYIM